MCFRYKNRSIELISVLKPDRSIKTGPGQLSGLVHYKSGVWEIHKTHINTGEPVRIGNQQNPVFNPFKKNLLRLFLSFFTYTIYNNLFDEFLSLFLYKIFYLLTFNNILQKLRNLRIGRVTGAEEKMILKKLFVRGIKYVFLNSKSIYDTLKGIPIHAYASEFTTQNLWYIVFQLRLKYG